MPLFNQRIIPSGERIAKVITKLNRKNDRSGSFYFTRHYKTVLWGSTICRCRFGVLDLYVMGLNGPYDPVNEGGGGMSHLKLIDGCVDIHI
jgi:hypothetical protein